MERHLEVILRRYPSQAQAIEFSKRLHNDVLEDSYKEPAMESSTTSWERHFSENPHSNKMLYELLPAAIEVVMQADQDYNDPLAFPPPVLLWWAGQKQILFYDVVVSGPKVILSILNNCQKATLGFKSFDTSSLPNVLKGLMEIQKQRLEQEKGIKSPQHEKSVYVHSRFDGRDVPTKCAGCGKGAGAVSNPTYSANRPNHYVVVNKAKCSGCGRKTKRLPIHGVHTSINTIHSTAPKIEYGARIESMVQLRQTLTQQQLRPVESGCLRCGEKTEVTGGGNVYIDLEPQWTLGNRRPLYIERRPICFSCQKLNRSSDRFIPKDPAVPSIFHQTLTDLADRYGRYDPCIIAILLDHWPQSSRTHMNRV
jgi:Fe-S-cluster-containing hydrogenase component 2